MTFTQTQFYKMQLMAILIVLNALATNDAIQLQYWINHTSFYSLNMKSRYEQLKPYQDSN